MPSIRPMRMRRRTWLVEWAADELTLEWDRGFTLAPLTKKGELGPLAALPRFPRLSLSSSRDSLPSRIGKRGECRANRNKLGNKFASLRKSHTMRTGVELNKKQAPNR